MQLGWNKNLKKAATLLVSTACTAALFWAIGRETSFSGLMDIFGRSDLRLVCWFIFLSLAALFVRCLRYQILFRAFSGEKTPFDALLAVTAIRNAVVDLLPARLGELLTIYFLRQAAIPLVTATHAIAGLFILDIAVLGVMTAAVGVLFYSDIARFFPAGAGGPLICAAGVFGLSAFVIFLYLDLIAAKVVSIPPLRRFSGVSRRITADYQALRSSNAVAALAGTTFALRILKYGALYLVLLAVIKQWQIGPAEVPFAAAFGCFLAAEGTAILPVGGLLGFGAYEGGWALFFKYLGLKTIPVFSVIFAVHVITQVVALFLAVIGFGWISRNGGDRTEKKAISNL